MRIPFLVTLVLILSLSACNLPATATAPVASGLEGPAAGMPQFLTNASDPGDGIPTGPQIGTTMLWVDNSILVYVPGGEFIMGTDGGEDNPTHTITLSPFWIYRAEVTNTQYAMCMAAGQCSALGDAEAAGKLAEPLLRDHPVVGVTYAQAEAYCTWIQGDLPTEAQWEKTARGPDTKIYPWGADVPTCDLTNFNNCNLETTNIREHLSGKSHYEALDLAGNVFEWVMDWYGRDYYNESPPADPPGPSDGTQRIVRGGGYQTVEVDLLSSKRFSLDPLSTRQDLGFRCVVNNPGNFAPYCTASPLFTGGRGPGGPGADDPGSACEPPRVNVGGSYCTLNRAFVNIFAEGEVSISDDALQCNDAGDGLMTCSGPHNFSGEVEVCGACDAAPVVENEPAEGQAEVPPGPNDACPNPGYIFNPQTQNCEWIADEGEPASRGDGNTYCQVGLEPDPTGTFCNPPLQPADGMGECPNWGYAYDPATQMCRWRRHGNSPSGICLDPATGFAVDRSQCEPGGDIGHWTYQCPLGMEVDATGAFCVQVAEGGDEPPAECPNGICDVAEDDFACPVGTFLDPGIGVCVPASGMPGDAGCIAGFVFDPEFACCQATFDNSSACAPGELVDPMLGCIRQPSINDAPGSSCITVKVGLPNCTRDTGDTPGGGDDCSQHNGNFGACTAAGCSYDTLTNTCN